MKPLDETTAGELRAQLRLLAARFVDDLVALVTGAAQSADAVARAAEAAGKKRVRRPNARLHELADAIVAALAVRPDVRVSVLAAAVGVATRDITRPLVHLVRAGRIIKTGERRSTVYSLPRPAPARPARPRAAKPLKKARRR